MSAEKRSTTTVAVLLALLALLLAAVLGRFHVAEMDGYPVVLDRWTGEVCTTDFQDLLCHKRERVP